MKVAVLYRKPPKVEEGHHLDWQGREGLKHIMRIKDVLESLGHTPQLVDVNLDSFEQLRRSDFDLVFNLCDDGFKNNPLLEAHVPAMLDILEIPYTGSNFFTLATCVNKARTKEILAFHGIDTPEFQIFERSSQRLNDSLNFPLIVKPLHEDASIGVRKESVVNNIAQLRERVNFVISNYHQSALVERFISGREVYVGILGNRSNLIVLPISEVIFDSRLEQGDKICSYEAKWLKDSQQYQNTPVRCPAELDEILEQKLIKIAKKAYILLGCQDYGRIDFRIDEEDQPYVLEVNPNPDLSSDAGLAKMAQASGMDYNTLIEKILTFALARKP